MNNATVCSRKCSFFVLQIVRSTIEVLQKTEKTLPRSHVRILIYIIKGGLLLTLCFTNQGSIND